MILWHATDRENREEILRLGLCARDTTEHIWRDEQSYAGINAVYAYCTGSEGWIALEHQDIWEIDATNLPVEPDPAVPNGKAFRILTNIPPERIQLLHRASMKPNKATGKETQSLYRKKARAQIAVLLGFQVKELSRQRAVALGRKERSKKRTAQGA